MNAVSYFRPYDPKRDPRIMHFIEADFGTLGLAFVETGPAEADYESRMALLLAGQIERPTRIIQVIVEEGLSGDVTEDVARDLVERAAMQGLTLADGVFEFCKAHLTELAGFVKLQDGDLWTEEQAHREDKGITVLYMPNEHSTLRRGSGGVL